MGRGRIASAMPDSMSLATLGAATRVEPSARTPLNMNATRIVNWEAASRTSAGVTPFMPGNRLKPQLVSAMTTTVSTPRASSRRRRDASRIVSRAMVRAGGTTGRPP